MALGFHTDANSNFQMGLLLKTGEKPLVLHLGT